MGIAAAEEYVALGDHGVWDKKVTASEPYERSRELVRLIALHRGSQQWPGVNDDGQCV